MDTTYCSVLEIAIPYADAKTKDLVMYRYHDSEASVLTKVDSRIGSPSSGDDGKFYVDKEQGYIFLYACKFSTYAIGTPKSSGGSGGGGTSGTDSSGGSSSGSGSGSSGSSGTGSSSGTVSNTPVAPVIDNAPVASEPVAINDSETKNSSSKKASETEGEETEDTTDVAINTESGDDDEVTESIEDDTDEVNDDSENHKACHWHLITIIAFILAALYEILRRKKLDFKRIAGVSAINLVVAILVIILGSCKWDVILGIISMIAVPVLGWLIRNEDQKSEKN